MTRQEMFNKAYLGVIAQGGPAVNHGSTCRYRTDDGRACGVGQLIPDEVYSEAIEQTTLPMLTRTPPDLRLQSERIQALIEALEASGIAEEDWTFLEALQAAHDTAVGSVFQTTYGFMDRFKEKMVLVAEEFELDVPETP